MIPAPILLFGIRLVFNHLKKIRLFNGMVETLTHRSLGKSENIIKLGLNHSTHSTHSINRNGNEGHIMVLYI